MAIIQRLPVAILVACVAFAALSPSVRAQSFDDVINDYLKPRTGVPEAELASIIAFNVDLGGGVVWSPSDRDLEAFNQAVRFNPGASGKVGAGVVVKPGPGPLLIDVGLEGYYDELAPGLVVNKLAPGSVTVEGFSRAFGLAPRIGLSGEIVPGTQWYVGAGGGIAFQAIELRTVGGPVVMSGTQTTLMGHADVGVRHEIAPCVFLGVEAYANFYGGYDVRTSTNVVSPLGSTVETGLRATLRVLTQARLMRQAEAFANATRNASTDFATCYSP